MQSPAPQTSRLRVPLQHPDCRCACTHYLVFKEPNPARFAPGDARACRGSPCRIPSERLFRPFQGNLMRLLSAAHTVNPLPATAQRRSFKDCRCEIQLRVGGTLASKRPTSAAALTTSWGLVRRTLQYYAARRVVSTHPAPLPHRPSLRPSEPHPRPASPTRTRNTSRLPFRTTNSCPSMASSMLSWCFSSAILRSFT
jgi:hypothetical protein